MAKEKNSEPEKLDLRSHDLGEDKKAELARLFPEVRTEGGKIDFDRLTLVLGQTIDVGRERYGLNWPGKAECFKTLLAPSLATLRPVPDESVNFDTTENLIIEGDNLEVLKLLQKSYLGKVKMIYIDPPYNTGNDFIYPDNFSESLQTYLEYTSQVDAEGRKFSTNTETDGRFHSKWLNMMYPRLYLARNLLSEDGVVCISIDDAELQNLRRVCDEVFGEECFVGMIVVQANKRGQTYKEIAKAHEYICVYSANPEPELNEFEKQDGALPYRDKDGPFDLWELRNRNPRFGRFNRPNLFFPFCVAPSLVGEDGYAPVSLNASAAFTVKVLPLNSEGEEGCWRWQPASAADALGLKNPAIVARQRRDGVWNIYQKSRKNTTKAKSLWVETDVISEQGTIQMGALGLGDAFEHPKPLGLVQRCLQLASGPSALVLDFFAGSGTTAHAALELNALDGGNRRFVLVQLPEPTSRADFPTIADITKERVRRAIGKLNEADAAKPALFDADKEKTARGFRVFKLSESNFNTWDATASTDDKALMQQLELHVDHIRLGRTDQDLLYEILMKSGYPLTTSVESITVEGKPVFAIGGGALLVCLDRGLTLELIRALAARKPSRVVCLDAGFADNDQLKTNAAQTFKTNGVVFKTV